MPSETSGLLSSDAASSPTASFRSFITAFSPLGLLAFGGPSAHVALMHDKFVAGPPAPPAPSVPDATFVELFALSSALPGPGSTQLATALGATFGGLLGALITLAIWQIPGGVAMTLAGLWFNNQAAGGKGIEGEVDVMSNYFIGLVAAALAMVIIAAAKISSKSAGDTKVKAGVCVVTAATAVLVSPQVASWLFVLLLIGGGVLVLLDQRLSGGSAGQESETPNEWNCHISEKSGAAVLVLFFAICVLVFAWEPSDLGGLIFKSFWKIGATGFGGGQVVIPLILTECADFLPVNTFLFGFGLIALAPGPMFNMSFFLGAALFGVRGALLAGLGLFGPGTMLIIATLPFWERMRMWGGFRLFLSGVNAAASGLIIAGVWMIMAKTLLGPLSYAIAITAGALSIVYGVPTPVNILLSGVLGALGVYAGIGGPYLH